MRSWPRRQGSYEEKNSQPDGGNSNRSCSAYSLFSRPTSRSGCGARSRNLLTPSRNTTRFRRPTRRRIRRQRSRTSTISSRSFRTPRCLQYVNQLYYQTYQQMKNYPKAIEYADKLVAMGDKVDPAVVLGALQARVQAFSRHADESLRSGRQRSACEGTRRCLAGREIARSLSQAGRPRKCPTTILPSRRSPESRSSIPPLAAPRCR